SLARDTLLAGNTSARDRAPSAVLYHDTPDLGVLFMKSVCARPELAMNVMAAQSICSSLMHCLRILTQKPL
ncbi:hypothetical protein NLX62_05930, partial [Mycobacteriaceae bacterium Msp059]|nr:hypothetical protein [Mycobacteriaceae bacterium Msp059]